MADINKELKKPKPSKLLAPLTPVLKALVVLLTLAMLCGFLGAGLLRRYWA